MEMDGLTVEVASQTQARALYRTATICDLTLPFNAGYMGREAVLDRFHAAGITYVSLTVGGDNQTTGALVHNIADVRNMLRKRDGRFVLVRGVADIHRAKAEGRLAVGLHLQGSACLESNANLVEIAYDLGIRHALLVYNQMNAAATGCHERVDAGLSRHGRRLVAEMNRVGMIVDCTHTSYKSTMEIMEASTAPVMFSHSNAAAVYEHERNIRDDQIVLCARGGGVIGVTGVGKFMSQEGKAAASDLLPHIRHIADLVGPQHVALGIDHVYFLEQHYATVAAHGDRWTKGYPPPPWYYIAPEDMPDLCVCLARAGFSDSEILGVLGENYLRLAQDVWK